VKQSLFAAAQGFRKIIERIVDAPTQGSVRAAAYAGSMKETAQRST
jgi:hypothetical protein